MLLVAVVLWLHGCGWRTMLCLWLVCGFDFAGFVLDDLVWFTGRLLISIGDCLVISGFCGLVRCSCCLFAYCFRWALLLSVCLFMAVWFSVF